jgi:hypothetical protein
MATSLWPSSSLVPPPQVEDSPAGRVQTPCRTQPGACSFPCGRGTTRDRPRTVIGNPISPSFILNSSLSALRSRSSLDISGLVALGSVSSQWACPGIAPRFTPTRPLVRLQPKSPGDPNPEVTALGRDLKEAAFPFDTSESFIPRVPSDTPSDEIEAGTTIDKVSFARKERGKSSTRIKVETVQDDNESSKRIIPSTRPGSIKSISLITSDQGTVDPLETFARDSGPSQRSACNQMMQKHLDLKDGKPMTQDDWIDLIWHDPEGFQVLVALMAT